MRRRLTDAERASVERTIREATRSGVTTISLAPLPESLNNGSKVGDDAASPSSALVVARSIKDASIPSVPVKKRGARAKAVERTENPARLRMLKPDFIKDTDGNTKCGVCGKTLMMGDVFYTENLANYGASVNGEQVCKPCMDEILRNI